ncbi:MAG: aminopeptidase N, partial [Actinomycetota bacterium]|nr:aminopeptidase N [Actinomycetota bacterium]
MSTNLTRVETTQRVGIVSGASYLVELDLSNAADATATTFRSRSTLRFAGSAGAATFVDLIADSVHSVSLNGEPLDVAGYDGARLTIGPLAADNELVVDAACRYSVTGEG